jgi:hypothetical protein
VARKKRDFRFDVRLMIGKFGLVVGAYLGDGQGEIFLRLMESSACVCVPYM